MPAGCHPGESLGRKMKILKNIFNVIYWLVIFVLVLVAAATSFSALKIPGGLKMLVVQSGSMEPVIKTGSIILIKKQDTYSTGDIISFVGASQDSTTHRITKITIINGKEVFNTKGDANQGEDRETVKTSNILGKTVFTVPYLGYLIAFTRTQQGFIFLIVIPATIIIFSEILNIKREILLFREKRKSKQPLPSSEEKKWSYLTHD